jgi:hypothetical protein
MRRIMSVFLLVGFISFIPAVEANDQTYRPIYDLSESRVVPRYYTRTRPDGTVSVYDLKKSYRTPRYEVRQHQRGQSIYDAGSNTPKYMRADK